MRSFYKDFCKLFFCLVCCAQSGCGEKLHYKKYEYEKYSVSFNEVAVNFSMLTTFKEDPKDSNKGTFGAPYSLRLSFSAPASDPFESIELKNLVMTGGVAAGDLTFGEFNTEKFWPSLQDENKVEGAIIIPVSKGNNMKFEDFRFTGTLSFKVKGQKQRADEKFDIVLKTNFSEEKKGKRMAEIMGI